MTTVTNRDVHTRIWGNLTNKDTGTTLELAPGESADVDLPPGFEDLHLQGAVERPPSVPAPAVSLSVSPTEAPVADPGEKE